MDDDCATYLGQKGYTIYKESLSISEQHFIREALTVKPYVPKSLGAAESFPIYQESNTKIYMPRYFGQEHYGIPDDVRIDEGKDINLTFTGVLRDYQQKAVATYIKEVNKPGEFGGGGLLELGCGQGKTVIALHILSLLKKKTLIVVHKGFLLDQWKERIAEFLPTAKIGRIQGQIIDIDGKDIVIGMLQSLSMKAYPRDLFNDFGLTITDEVHHISSEVFSRSLQTIVTKYSLGLSATMQRKDGLTKVFKMYLGNVAYKAKRDTTIKVLVKAIKYCVEDTEFNKTELDYRGNIKYSTMISKLCKFNRRSEFIINVIKTELEKKPNQQMIILGHNKNLLVYLYQAIEHRKIASVGYYLGGMKDKDLKKSETKKIIVATYAMAAEGLDIKTLTTAVFVTPRTDITQAEGRILRTKDTDPMIIDILDTHSVFHRQWEKRKKYYMKNKYTIIHTNNDLYESDQWVTIEKEKKKKAKCFVDTNSITDWDTNYIV
jgi:superfamily II DNA or RNA helicase